MANDPFILQPHEFFTVKDEENPDDYGIRCAAVKKKDGVWLMKKSGKSMVNACEHHFPSIPACIAYARQMYRCNGYKAF